MSLAKAELETAESRVKDKLHVWQKLSKFAILSIYDLNFCGKLLNAVNKAIAVCSMLKFHFL
jgi:hypothetical protein